MPAKMFAINYT